MKKARPANLTKGGDYLMTDLGCEVELANVIMRLHGAEDKDEFRREGEIVKAVRALVAVRKDRISLEELQSMNKKISEVEDLVRSTQGGIVRASDAPTFDAPTRERTH